MDGLVTCQPEGFGARRVQPSVVNRLCRSLHGAFYSLFCIPNCVKRSRETYVNRTYWRNSYNFRGFTPAWRASCSARALQADANHSEALDHPLWHLDIRAHIVGVFHGAGAIVVNQ